MLNINDKSTLENHLSININPIPIIAIDGPTASGKGTIARALAKKYGYHYLNCGALYRLTAHLAIQKGVDLQKLQRDMNDNVKSEETQNIINEILEIGASLAPIFLDNQVIVDGVNVWDWLSKEEAGRAASLISPIPELRAIIYKFQRAQIRLPGLVVEGRDMATGVYTDALVKIYLDVNIEEQARRRWKDEQEKNSDITLEKLTEILRARDADDKNRKHGTLKISREAYYIDTSDKNVEQVLELCTQYINSKLAV